MPLVQYKNLHDTFYYLATCYLLEYTATTFDRVETISIHKNSNPKQDSQSYSSSYNNHHHHHHHHHNNDDDIERHNSTLSTISSLWHKLPPTSALKQPQHSHVLITCNTSGANFMQPVVCHTVWTHSSAIKFDRVGITFILASFH